MAQRKKGEKKTIYKVDDNLKEKIFSALLHQNIFELAEVSHENLVDFIFWAIKPQDFAITHRTIKYLLSALKLSLDYNGPQIVNKKVYGKGLHFGGDGFIHHDLIHDFCFKNYGGVDFTGYSKLSQAPYGFLDPKTKDNNLIDRDGTYRPNPFCIDFLRGKVSVPERIVIIKNELQWVSPRMIRAHQAPEIDFKSAISIYKQIII